MLDLRDEVRTYVAQRAYRAVRGGIGSHSEESIVALRIPAFGLLGLDHTNEA